MPFVSKVTLEKNALKTLAAISAGYTLKGNYFI
ncbi:hypothetical protein SAMN04488128_1023 [Chitinophaga eiseniae]|uniref:Uncharacterized protein n=1 Tax=Chitinophaga eiseniae TaxID=634771 RepID=A0A1T4PTI2_9BACT|nr:hypothetical protein SAMN04488128_1023 [Chitinophaga eiseniae]